ncbi:MAG: protein-export chaperone SecB [Alphaproteobacteria bacterium]
MSDTNAEAEGVATSAMPINILAQYIRDISFENPMAPDSLRSGLDNPEMDISIGMDARKLPDKDLDNLYEVVVNLRAVAQRSEEQPLFILEMQYGVTVALSDIPEDNHHAVLLIEIPRLAFPYVRQIVSDLTTQGGYPPLILNPVDFRALYMERFKDEIAQAERDLQEEEAPKKKSVKKSKNDE